ncbi:MAG TPA: Mur ligase family protein, partial [Acidimicrobiales bacterium]|nr:Mur ligase family protein [Acidimicrobiales bacterium]
MPITPSVPMNLLFDDIEVIESMGDPSGVQVGGIAHDSRRVVPGDLFCCVPGAVSDGHTHAVEAVERGAVGLLCEHFIPELLDRDVVQTRVAAGTMRPTMARLAGTFYGHPARDLLMIGVTGTNGKTTVTQLLGDLLSATGRPTNVLGTLSGARTTPEAIEVQRVLAAVRDRQRSDGARHAVAMEVSSHALVQSRVEGIHFDVAVFTNLSHDHLDYHGTM